MPEKELKNFLLLLTLLLLTKAQATHLLGGEIIARQAPNAPLTFEITVIGYTDAGDSQIEFGGGVLRFGDETVQSGPFSTTRESLGATEKVTFTVTHTFLAPSAAGYLLSYVEDFRNDNIININNGNSVQTSFYIESLLVMDPFLGPNNTPYFTAVPNEYAAIGKKYQYNPGAYDPDGDLLTYRFVDVKRAHNTVVGGYRSLNHPDFYTNFNQGNEAMDGEPTLTIDRFTGEIVWDAPGDITNQDDPPHCEKKAEYMVAIAVDEWRKVNGTWKKMGYVTRDYKINVCGDGSYIPIAYLPKDTCIVAGTSLDKAISITDSELGYVKLYGFGIPFELGGEKNQTDEGLDITWDTECAHVKPEPYQIQIRLSNGNSNPPFTDYYRWNVNVMGPEVTGLSIQDQQDGSAALSWDAYSCPNADSIEIWRKEGPYVGNVCDLVDPTTQGFTQAGIVPAGQHTFVDSQLPTGTNKNDFTWHLSATFPGDRYDYNELISVLTGVEPTEVDKINIFPNPTGGTIFINGSNNSIRQYHILNLSGQLMKKGELKSGRIDNLDALQDGMYIISLVDEKQQQVHGARLLVQK